MFQKFLHASSASLSLFFISAAIGNFIEVCNDPVKTIGLLFKTLYVSIDVSILLTTLLNYRENYHKRLI